MKPHSFDPTNPTGLTVRDPYGFANKLLRFAQAGPTSIYLLIDFDRTLTTSKHTGDNTTTWQIMHDLLPQHGQEISNQIRDKYLAIEANGGLSSEDSKQFSVSVLELHTTHQTERQAIEAAAKRIKLRHGSQELFAACERAAIPTVILSAGIGDIIEHIADSNDIRPTQILSTKLTFDAGGRVEGWHQDSLVLTHNKSEHVARFLPHFQAERTLTIMVGDTVGDAHILAGDGTVLRIRVADLKLKPTEQSIFLHESFAAGYDAVVEEDLSSVAAIIEWLHSAQRAGR